MPQIYVNNLYSSSVVFHPGLRLGCCELLERPEYFQQDCLAVLARVIANANVSVYFLRMYLPWLWPFFGVGP